MVEAERLPVTWRWVAGVAGLCAVVVAGCGDRQEEAVAELGEAGFGFSVRDYLRAAAEGRMAEVERFLEAGMAVDAASATGETALLRAVDNRHVEMVEFLLAQGASVEVVSPAGEPVALKAAQSGEAELVEAVLGSGADPCKKAPDGWAPLTAAAYAGSTEVVRVLAPKCRQSLDDALYLAAIAGSTEVADVLLNQGASVYARSPDNRTALMYAAENGHEEVVKLLLRNGANRFALDDEDLIASDLAADSGHAEIATYLREPRLVEEDAAARATGGGWGIAVAELGPDGAGAPAGSPAVDVAGEAGAGGEFLEPVEFGAARASDDSGVNANAGVEAAATAGPTSEVPAPAPAPAPAGRVRLDPTRVPGGSPTVAGVAARAGAAPAPAPRLDGAVIRSRGPERREVRLADDARLVAYRETQLPVILKAVDEGGGESGGGGEADVRVLYGNHAEPVRVAVGEVVPDTGLEVVSVKKKFVYSKQGRGEATDVSEMILLDRRSGTKHLVRKDFPAGASETYAVMTLAGGGAYDVRTRDEFTVEGDATRYRVVDVRPTQIVIEDASTGDAITVQRFGTALR